ncbi:arabinogalactan protein 1-like [Cynara cardunculus var. scolymus]|uniref:arabinogalactan protein 1-like n=1 Tax=Cynara cardunculus var. scolymus TaxID=59895 RepID=UPI000D62FBCD|nr:arabinogalactan protein 1-like [Cynara cardunculus var. scolymus]
MAKARVPTNDEDTIVVGSPFLGQNTVDHWQRASRPFLNLQNSVPVERVAEEPVAPPTVQPNAPPVDVPEPQDVAVSEPPTVATTEPPAAHVTEPPVVPMTKPSTEIPGFVNDEASPSKPPPSNPLGSGYGSATWLLTPMPITSIVAAPFAPAPRVPVAATVNATTAIIPAVVVPVDAPVVQSSKEADAVPACLQ